MSKRSVATGLGKLVEDITDGKVALTVHGGAYRLGYSADGRHDHFADEDLVTVEGPDAAIAACKGFIVCAGLLLSGRLDLDREE